MEFALRAVSLRDGSFFCTFVNILLERMRVKNNFTQGKLNQDVGERLLPNGQFLDAENIRVITTDSAELGSVTNLQGNKRLTSYNLINAHTIGAYADDANYKLYWFVTSDEKDMVLEYDTKNNIPTVVLESSRPGVLNFDKNHFITGVVKINNDSIYKDLLVWTDDYNEPRLINIERAKTYPADGFIEDDISLIKKPPKFAPATQLTFTTSTKENNLENKFLSFAYRYKYLDGQYSALSSFTNYQFAPKQFDLDYQTMENNGMVNNFNAIKILFDTGDLRVTDIEIVFKQSNANNIYLIERFNKAEENWDDNDEKSFVFSNSKIYQQLPTDELLRAFDNVPRKAKALELIGNRVLFGNYVEGYDLKNIYGEDVNMDYELEVVSNDITGQPVPIVVSGDRNTLTIDLSSVTLSKNSRLIFNLELDETATDGSFSGNIDYILNSDYPSASALSTDPEFIFFIENVLTAKFTQDYTATPPANSQPPSIDGFVITGSTGSSITLGSPTLTYTIDDTPSDPNDDETHDESFKWKFLATSSVFFNKIAVASSLKTNRSYEVGVVYRDEECRKTTVLTCADNTIYIPQDLSTQQNKIKVKINHLPPSWADTYKLVLKQNKGEYHTIYTNIFYQDGIYRWVLLEGANVDKVKVGDTLIVKSDISGPIFDVIRVRVLEITTKEKNFLEGNLDTEGLPILEEPGLYMKIKPVGFDMTFDAAVNRLFYGALAKVYPERCYTSPVFGEIVSGVFVPYKLKSGSRVKIRIRLVRTGLLSGNEDETYEKSFRVQTDYNSVKEWFDAEVQNLGQFGIQYTWDGVSDIGPGYQSNPGYGQGDTFHRGSGWDFTPDGSQFWVIHAKKAGPIGVVIVAPVLFQVFFSEGDVIFETEPKDITDEIYYETEQTFEVTNGLHEGNITNQTLSGSAEVLMDAFNCYVQGNGAESYRYKDTVLGNYLNIDLRPSATSVEKYREVRRYADLTYSEPYNDSTNINGLNEFNLARANYKDDINKRYGSIQKLFGRDNDVLVLQEDKISKVFFEKDLLMNPDGTGNVTSIASVLGQQVPYAGEYGISRNPESFVYDGFNIYFTDVKRGTVMRLAGDGLNEITFGVNQFIKNAFQNEDDYAKKGGYDPTYDEYYLYDSNDLLIPPVILPKNKSYVNNNFTGDMIVTFDYGVTTGEASLSFESNGIPMKFTIDYGNGVLETGFYGDSSYNDELIALGYDAVVGGDSDTFVFTKTKDLPPDVKNLNLSNVKVTVFTPFEEASVTLTPTPPVEVNRSVVTLILHDEPRDKYSFDTRTNFDSGTDSIYQGRFDTVGDTFDKVSGVKGVGKIPNDGKRLYLPMRFNGDPVVGRIKYFLSDTQYMKDDISIMKPLFINLPVTDYIDDQGNAVREASFILSSFNKQYLYLLYDYST